MGSREEAISLYLLSVHEDGIPKSLYDTLTDVQKTMVEESGGTRPGMRGAGGGVIYTLQPDVRSLFAVALTGGVFDIIHPGHVHTLMEAKKEADVLVVVVATDETVRTKKGREPLHSQDERAELVNSLKPVDLAIVGVSDWKQTLKRVSPDIVVFGYDQTLMDIPGVRTRQLATQVPNAKTSAVRDKLGL